LQKNDILLTDPKHSYAWRTSNLRRSWLLGLVVFLRRRPSQHLVMRKKSS
jgi:hypothetical protein